MLGVSQQHDNLNLILAANPDLHEGELWLGNLKAANNLRTLKARGIRTVVTVINNIELAYNKQDNMVHHYFSVPDVPSHRICTLFPQTNQLIGDGLRRGNVLVHCVAGVSRSATLVIAFLMESRGWGYEKAFCFVKERRNVNPNSGFRQQLIGFSKEIQLRLRDKTSPRDSRKPSQSFFQAQKTDSPENQIKENQQCNKQKQPYSVVTSQKQKTPTIKYIETSILQSVREVTNDDEPPNLYQLDTTNKPAETLKRYKSDPRFGQVCSADEQARMAYIKRLHEHYQTILCDSTTSLDSSRRADFMKRLQRIAVNENIEYPRVTSSKTSRQVPKHNAAVLYKSNYVL